MQSVVLLVSSQRYELQSSHTLCSLTMCERHRPWPILGKDEKCERVSLSERMVPMRKCGICRGIPTPGASARSQRDSSECSQ